MSFERPTGREVERVGFAQRVILAALALSVSLGSASASAEEGVDRAFAEVDVVERPGQRIPLDLTFLNEDGEAVELGSYFNRGRPVVLNLGYYGCPMLCGMVLNGFTHV